jgi:signal transduction histidine kinase
VRLSVRDTGAGIAPELVGKIFDPFVTTKASGLGMGLAIIKSIVEAHGGRIWVESDEGKGSTFTFLLPMEETHHVPAPSPFAE